MLAHVSDHVQISSLHIAPVFFSKWPDFSHSFRERVLTLVDCSLIIYESRWIIWIQKWTACAFFIVSVVWTVSDINLIVLEELVKVCNIYHIQVTSVQIILSMQDSMNEHGFTKVEPEDNFVALGFDSSIVHSVARPL